MTNATPEQPPHDRRESDQLPEEQPGAATPASSTPDERKQDVGLDPRPDPRSRRNTGNEHDRA